MAVWLHHTLEAERITRGMPRAVVFYADLLRDWRDCMARAGRIAGIAWPHWHRAGEARDHEVVDRSLRHHSAIAGVIDAGPPPIRGLIHETWSALWQLRDNPALPFVKEALDDVRARFAAWRAPSWSVGYADAATDVRIGRQTGFPSRRP